MAARGVENGHEAAEPSLRRFLELGAAQLDAAMREADAHVERLASLVGALAGDAAGLRMLTAHSDGARSEVPRLHERLHELAEALDGHVRSAISELQFYDRLAQRLTHVRDGLTIPVDSVGAVAPGSYSNRPGPLEQIRARYSSVEERVVFDFMIGGLSPEQMLKALAGMRAAASSGEYEAL